MSYTTTLTNSNSNGWPSLSTSSNGGSSWTTSVDTVTSKSAWTTAIHKNDIRRIGRAFHDPLNTDFAIMLELYGTYGATTINDLWQRVQEQYSPEDLMEILI